MSWTDRPEVEACCGEDPGAVTNMEKVARLRHTRVHVSQASPFHQDDFNPPKDRDVDNRCGESDGASVTRCSSVSDDKLRRMAEEQAQRRPGRQGTGALVANVGDLRAIRRTGDATNQVVFVYDDPTDDKMHAVLRMVSGFGRPDQRDILRKIVDAFREEIAA